MAEIQWWWRLQKGCINGISDKGGDEVDVNGSYKSNGGSRIKLVIAVTFMILEAKTIVGNINEMEMMMERGCCLVRFSCSGVGVDYWWREVMTEVFSLLLTSKKF